MANNNSKNKNNKKNNKNKVENTNKVNTNKNTNTSKKIDNKEKEVKKVNKKEEIKVEKVVEEVKVEKEPKVKKQFKLTSKQRDIVLVLLVAVVLVIALVLTGKKEPELNIELPLALEGKAGFTEITYSQYEEKLNSESPFVVVLLQDGCGFCEQYEPVVKKVAKAYKLPIYYINLANITSDEYNALANSNSYLRNERWGTPTTLFLYGETVVDSIGGYVDEATFKEFVEKNFVIGE